MYVFSYTEAQVLCQEWGLPVGPRGWQCQARTGLWGCWEAGPGAGGVGWLPEGRGRHSYSGKTGRGHVSCPCRFTAMDSTHVTGTEWLAGMTWVGAMPQPKRQTKDCWHPWGPACGPGSPYRRFLHPVLGDALWHLCCFDTSSVNKACVGNRLVRDVRPALRTASS